MSDNTEDRGLPAEDLEVRIESTFDELVMERRLMLEAEREISLKETNAKVENMEQWIAAKNGEVRSSLLAKWLEGDDEYWTYRKTYDDSRKNFRVGLLEAKRFELLIGARAIPEAVGS